MATAAPTESMRPFDPSRPAKYPIRLGESLLGPRTSTNRFTSVSFNHKPSQTGSKRTTTITPSNRINAPFGLAIEDEDDGGAMRCTYAGRKRELADSYTLTFDRERQIFQLDHVDDSYDFNMVSAPWEKDEAQLTQQYKQIDIADSQGSPLNGVFSASEDEEAGGDSDGPSESNPFDYRHYLNGLPTTTGTDSRQPSNVSTPVFGPRAGIASPTLNSRPSSGALRAANESPLKQTQQPASSRVHFKDRAASSKLDAAAQSDDDTGGLIIDEGPPPPAKKRRTAPPKSRARSSQAAPQIAPPAQQPSPTQQDVGSGYEEDDDSDEPKGANDDVDDLELPGPASSRQRPPMPRRQSTWDDGDEAALQAALEEAFQGEDDDDDDEAQPSAAASAAQPQKHESESESEEE